MIYRKIKEKSFFCYNEDLELVVMALLLLNGSEQMRTDLYTPEELAAWKKKYAFLFEIFAGMEQNTALFLLDACTIEDMPVFTLKHFAERVVEEAEGRLATEILDGFERDEIRKQIKSDQGLQELFDCECNRRIFSSFLGMRTLYRETEVWTAQFVAFAEELREERFLAFIKEHEKEVEQEYEELSGSLEQMTPLALSEKMMQKTFYHNGPFDTFLFSPVWMLGCTAIRFFGEHQIFLYNPGKKELDREVVLAQLKSLADETRISIIRLLNQKGPMCGRDIAGALKLAPSTVSHHIEQLKSAGLLNEEPVRNARYYSVRTESKEDFIRLLEDIFQK